MISTPDSSIRSRLPALRPAPGRKPVEKRTGHSAGERDLLLPPMRRGFQVIPTLDVLEKLIDRAVEALKAGIFWDRGSILNLLV